MKQEKSYNIESIYRYCEANEEKPYTKRLMDFLFGSLQKLEAGYTHGYETRKIIAT
jgi:uncharacterized protein YukJ